MEFMQKSMPPAPRTAEEWFAGPRAPADSSTTRIFDIGDLWRIVSSAKGLIIKTVIATTGLALAAGILMPKNYSASTQMFVDSRRLKILTNEVGPQAAVETAIADLESQIKILGSGSVLKRVVELEYLASDPAFIPPPGLVGRLKALIPGGSSSVSDIADTATAVLKKNVRLQRADRSFVVDIVVTDREPARAARISNAIAEVYLENLLNTRRDLARRVGGEVTGRLQDLRERVDASERRLNDFKTANNLIYSGGGLVAEQDLTELNNQLNLARARTARAKARIDQLNRLSGNTGTAATTEVLDSPTIVQLRIRLAEANRQVAELRRNLGPLHPEIQGAEARVREANTAISGEIDRRRSSVRNEYDQALASERVLSRQIDELKEKSTHTSSALIGLRELERAVEANKKVYEEFMLRSRELTEQQGIFANGSYIITPPVIPGQPLGPALPLLLAIGFFAGIPLGVGMALVRAQIAPGKQQNAESEKVWPALTSPAAAEAPNEAVFVNSGDEPLDAGQDDPPEAGNIAIISGDAIAAYLDSGCLKRIVTPPKAVLDFARSIENRLPAHEALTLLVIGTGSEVSGGAVSAALAACWTYDGFFVLAVDADPTTAQMSRVTDQLGSHGLFDRLHKNINDLIRWNRRGLPHFLAAADPVDRQPSAIAHSIIAQRLETLGGEFDKVILDAGQISRNPYSEELCDAAPVAIVVTNAGQTRQAHTEIAHLEAAGVYVVGIVAITEGRKSAQSPALRKNDSQRQRRFRTVS